MPLDDARLQRRYGSNPGIAFATDKHIEHSWAMDLGTRQALGVVLDVGRYGLQIANVYLDDLKEDTRTAQVHALLNELMPDVPTILVGDFNGLRTDMRSASLRNKVGNMTVGVLAKILPQGAELGDSIKEMDSRRIVPAILAAGYRDADEDKKRPTAPSVLPVLGIDYVFHNDQVAVKDLQVLGHNPASDHRGLTYSAVVE